MAIDIGTLENRYFDACKRQDIPPNKAVLAALSKAKIMKAHREMTEFILSMDYLKDVDIHPLLDMFKEIDGSEIDAVDIVNSSSCVLSGEHVSSLLHVVNRKLRVVDVCDTWFGKDFMMDLAKQGLACQALYLRSSHFRKLNMAGIFLHMHTLNLDFSDSLTSLHEDCFSCMPKLRLLSLCGTKITNLWTASAALAKLPSLVELLFQNCPYSNQTGYTYKYSPASFGTEGTVLGHTGPDLHAELPSPGDEIYPRVHIILDDMDDYDTVQDVRSTNEESQDDSEDDFGGHNHQDSRSNIPLAWDEILEVEHEIYFGTLDPQAHRMTSISKKKYFPSPICFEKYYREYMVASLPKLKVLDNLPIGKSERERAKVIFRIHFESLPYNKRNKESVVSILQQRETHASRKKLASSSKSQHFYSRSLSAAKMGTTTWPTLHFLSFTGNVFRDDRRSLRPRQFEYHPSDPSLMVFGTLDGEVVVVNHESEKIVSYIPSLGDMNSVLGLCWLKKYPSKLIAGSDNGTLRLYDIQHMPTNRGPYQSLGTHFDDFDLLTSVHVNSTDELFVASGYSRNVALYDISTGRRSHVFADMHREHINVVKFSNHNPSVFATSSFDKDVKMWDIRQKPDQPCYTASSSRGNVMVCFSPDDHYLLVSAIDNEVKQLLAVDGRLHLDFDLASTGSLQNYTRSYYMSGRDYIISGSCDENVVRICCANTGRRLRDVSLVGKSEGTSMFVQSLRGDPFRDFNMSILAAHNRPYSESEIVKVDLLSHGDHDKPRSYKQQSHSVTGVGG